MKNLSLRPTATLFTVLAFSTPTWAYNRYDDSPTLRFLNFLSENGMPLLLLFLLTLFILLALGFRMKNAKMRQEIIMEALKQDKTPTADIIDSISQFNKRKNKENSSLSYAFACAISGTIAFVLGVILMTLQYQKDSGDYVAYLICLIIPSLLIGGYGIGRVLAYHYTQKEVKQKPQCSERGADENSAEV